MKLKDLVGADCLKYRFISNYISGIDVKSDDIGILSYAKRGHNYSITINEKIFNIHLKDESSKQELEFQLNRNNANLIQVEWVQEKELELSIFFFQSPEIYFSDIQIGITDKVMQWANKKRIKDMQSLSDALNKDCMLSVNGESYFCARITAQDQDNENNDEKDRGLNSITIYGESYRLPIVRKSLVTGIDNKQKLLLSAIQPHKDKKNINYQLIKTNITWVKESASQAMSDYAKDKLARLTKDNGSYFKIWDIYVKKERELLLKKSQEIGNIAILNTEYCENGLCIYIDKDLRRLLKTGSKEDSNGDLLEIISKQDFLNSNDENKSDMDDKYEMMNNCKRPTTRVLSVKSNCIEVDNTEINSSHILRLSTYGDEIQVERRAKARERILTGRSANPNLGLIIEGSDSIAKPQESLRPIVLSNDIEKKIFKYGATPTQKRAVQLALNTPDIMLIQGPPGTGKTTVITAILEQLNVLQDKQRNMTGTVLISAFQHDAVDNLASRLTINDIPAIKFSSNDKHKYRNLEEVGKWATTISQHIEEAQPNFTELQEFKDIDDLADAYKFSPSRQQTTALLNAIIDCKKTVLNQEDEKLINDILKSFNTASSLLQEQEELKFAYNIRTTKQGYLDDGLSILIDVQERFGDRLPDEVLDLLNQTIEGTSLSIDEIITNSKKIKKHLIDILKPKPEFSTTKPRKDILQLLEHVRQISYRERKGFDNKEQILFDFRNELLTNPYGLAKALEKYNSIYAATVQQSDGKHIRFAKQAYGEDDYLVYDTVIVDEAARVGAMDLLIPMSQAKNRIILVGDHRQLPHMIEEEIVKEIEQNDEFDSQLVSDYLRDSIFEELFGLLKKMEKRDGIARTITLDAQYRSHPLLGCFASDCFYKPYDEAYESPTPADKFNQQLVGIEGKAAIWIDVPHQYGEKETKDGTSRYRDIEVDCIVEQLLKWLNSDEGEELSFGIISFYSAQVKRIKRKMADRGIDLEMINRQRERLRIGSVDAFQGMEFDIVFLSVVRTQSDDYLQKLNAHDTKMQSRVFGHLMSKNRLCVAVTRQKRALIMVGDAQMVNSDIGKKAVPELGLFYELCATNAQGVVL